jgi:hypothetical protein
MDKGTITYLYDATGNKLQKRVVDKSVSPSKTTTTTYLGLFTYEQANTGSQDLQFVAHEEGRIRPQRDQAGNITGYVYDYMLKDHLGNVRTLLTEEQKTDAYPAATMEQGLAAAENQLYANLDQTRFATANISGYPTDNTYSNPNQYVARTNGSDNKIGPSLTLKVMAGDVFRSRVTAWFQTATGSGSSPNPLAELVQALSSSLSPIAGAHGTLTQLQSSATISTQASSFLQNRPATAGPKAYLSYLLFNEQFQLKAQGSIPVDGNQSSSLQPLQTGDVSINQSGYLYVFVSNQTQGQNVFFDNLQVTHIHGPLLEENHYYPFGLTMAGISSHAAGNAECRKKFQGQELAHREFADGSGLDMYEFKWRMDDPQLGRFWQVDPLSNKYVHNSTYAFSENKVTAHIELEGLESLSISDLWRSAGISSSSDPKQFVRDVGNELTKPKTWFEGTATAGKIAGPIVLTELITGGTGAPGMARAEVNTIKLSTEVNLAERAKEIHGTLRADTQNFNTTAVASATTAEGQTRILVGSNEDNLRVPQRTALKPGEIAVSGVGHAEVTILNYAQANGMTVNAVAASRPICASCATAINNAGAVPVSPLKVYKQAVDATYVKPPPFLNGK